MPDQLTEAPDAQDIDFQRHVAERVSKAGAVRGINPLRIERIHDDVRFDDLVSDITGRSGDKISCPFHGNDLDPSFTIYRGSNSGFCFGCIEENELLWTERGLVAARDVLVTDRLLDKCGDPQDIVAKETKSGRLFAVETSVFRNDPLLLTPDHTCLYVRLEDAMRELPYIYRGKSRLGFDGRTKVGRTRKRRFAIDPSSSIISEGPLENVSRGDYLLFPAISELKRNTDAMPIHDPRTRGPKDGIIPELPVNPDACRIYGLYLAEGSINPHDKSRVVRWTYNISEKTTLAKDTQSLLFEQFGLDSTLFVYRERNTCEVVCSNASLARGLSQWFGQGAENKCIPYSALWWPKHCQTQLLIGHADGDGDCRGASTTVSKRLAYGVFGLGIQAGRKMSIGYCPAYTDKAGLSHRENWTMYPRQRERAGGFFQHIAGQLFYWMRVSDVKDTKREGRVVDFSVKRTSSFLTKLAAVHNCPAGHGYYDHIKFVKEYYGHTWIQALKWIEKKYALPPIADVALEQDEDEEITTEVTFSDLSEPFLARAVKEVRQTKDPELALEYIHVYFSAHNFEDTADEAKKAREFGEAAKLHSKAAMRLARVLGQEAVNQILDEKEL